MTKILIADDEASIRTILSKAMEKKGFEVLRAKNGEEALHCLKTSPVDVALLDIRMPDLSGLEVLSRQKEFPSHPYIFVITAQDTMENAIEAMKRGAYDYLTKPFDLDELSLLVDRALETRKLQTEVLRLKQEIPDSHQSQTIIGKSKAIKEVYKTIGKVANQDVTVLIEGESGTGKELVAKAIHLKGKRSSYPFLAVNCSAIPANLLESELFGYKKGAFTGAASDKAGYFEKANLGTLFLDEIGDLPSALQGKLLRVLQEKEIQRLGSTETVPVDVRIVAATNQNLSDKIKKGSFREDLYFRLNVVPIEIPPLRERKSDILLLVDYFLLRNAKEFQCDPKKISQDALDYLSDQKWQGNVRELENLLKRVFVLTQGHVLEAGDFKTLTLGISPSPSLIKSSSMENFEELIGENLKSFFNRYEDGEISLYDRFISLMERPLIKLALHQSNGNQLKASRLIGINRNTLRKKIRELGINRIKKM